jgi:hypothetical protein
MISSAKTKPSTRAVCESPNLANQIMIPKKMSRKQKAIAKRFLRIKTPAIPKNIKMSSSDMFPRHD